MIVGSAGHLTLCSFGRAEQRSPGHPALLADHHDLARLGQVLLDRARPAAGRAERRARAHLGAVLDAVSRAADLPGACDAWRQLDPGTDLPGAARLLGLAAVGTVGAIALWWAGGRIGPSAPPQVAATAITIVRWSAVAACGYLAVVAGASGLAVAARATDLATTMLRAAPVPVPRLLGGAIGAGVLSLLAPRAPTPAPTPPPSSSVPTPAETPTTTPTPTLTTTTPTPSLAPATTTPTATTAPTPTPSPAPATTTPTATTPTATIGPGDHLWAVAERTLTERSGRPPTEREVGRYWLRLVALNRSRLADPTNPDLVLVGQVVELPD